MTGARYAVEYVTPTSDSVKFRCSAVEVALHVITFDQSFTEGFKWNGDNFKHVWDHLFCRERNDISDWL